MRTIFFSFIILFSSLAQLNAQEGWSWLNPTPQGNYLLDVYLFNEDSLVIFGDWGTTLRTTNNGLSWDIKYLQSGIGPFRSVDFINNSLGYGVGFYGSMYKTTDGGFNWTYHNNFNYWLWSIKFVDDQNGFVCGYKKKILKTTDIGVTWIQKYTAWDGDFLDMAFINPDTGWVVGSLGAICKTTDAGETWLTIPSNVSNNLYSIDFTNYPNGIITGNQGIILVTTNGGLNWQPRSSGIISIIYSVTFLGNNEYIAVGNSGYILKTTDNGYNWTVIKKESSIPLYKVKSVNNKVWVVGDNGTILYSTDKGLTWGRIGTSITFETLNGLDVINGNNLFAVGGNGVVINSLNRGIDWIIQNSNTKNELRDVKFIDQNSGWAVGDSGTVIKTSNGGVNWTTSNIPVSKNLESVDFFDQDHGVTVGNGGALFITSNGGTTWINRTTGGYIFYDVNILNNSNCWASGWDGISNKIFYTSDRGYNWHLIGSISGNAIFDLFFINELVGLGAGMNGIWKTTNGGVSWVHKGGTEDMYSINFIDNLYGWAVGQYGEILRTTNGGDQWFEQIYERVTPYNLNSAYFIDRLEGFAVGSNGTIIKTDNGSPTPVELVLFEGIERNKTILLNWITATELNNNGFEIQRKFAESQFVTIGFVKGGGTTTNQREYSFIDKELVDGKYFYRLKQIDFNGSFEYSDVVEVEIAPSKFSLNQNYPNPFNPSTKISWQSPVGSWQTLKVFDVLGNEVATLVNEYRDAGKYETEFNAEKLSSGVYYYQLRAGDPSTSSGQGFVETKKMIYLK